MSLEKRDCGPLKYSEAILRLDKANKKLHKQMRYCNKLIKKNRRAGEYAKNRIAKYEKKIAFERAMLALVELSNKSLQESWYRMAAEAGITTTTKQEEGEDEG